MTKLIEEQKEYFNNCPQVEYTTDFLIFFKKEFKEKFYEMYSKGMKPRAIFECFGIDVNILTKDRMNGFRCKLLYDVKRNGGTVPDRTYKQGNNSTSDDSPVYANNLEVNFKKAVKRINELESILQYKDQEISFLKKITSTTKRKEHSCSET